MLSSRRKLVVGLPLLISLLALPAFSAQVTQVKSNKVMIDNQGDDLQVGQEYYLVNGETKKVGLVQISIVKNGKAIAVITKGKSAGKESLQLNPGSTAAISEDVDPVVASDASPGKVYRYGSKKVSVVLNLFSNSMTAKEADKTSPTPNIEDVSMKGSSFGITGVLDMPLNGWFTLRGTAGYEPFKASGTAYNPTSCDNQSSANCTAEMTYLSFGAYGRFDFYKSKAILGWGAVGGTMKLPMSKTSTALKTDDIKMTATYGFALGMDYFINHKYFIPVSIEQQVFMPSDTVKASIMAIRFGVGMAL
ncbi:MAG: hypothetical protein H7256_03160 [Bdellovibrio sp.]|nr:hypothetical protein [Bdellovibrio sp.]